MEAISSYILSVIAGAMLCAVVIALAGNGSTGKLLKLMSGIVMAAVVIRPMTEVTTVNLSRYLDSLNADAMAAVAEGTDYARKETEKRIKTNLESYILDKAAALSLDITVDLTLNTQTMLPSAVVIAGNASPHARAVISAVLTDDLGIPAEALTWN